MMHFCHEGLFLPLQTVQTLMKYCIMFSRSLNMHAQLSSGLEALVWPELFLVSEGSVETAHLSFG